MVGRGTFSLLDGQFKLVEQSQSGSALFLHNTMCHFAIEADLEHTQGVLNQVEIVHFGLLVPSIYFK